MLSPHFFDIFGALFAVYIIFFSYFLLKRGTVPRWSVIVLLLIGVSAFFTDVSIVYKYYLKNIF